MPYPYDGEDYSSYGPNADIMSMFQRYSRDINPTDVASYLDPNDPDVMRLRDLYSQPSGANDLVSSYINEMPTREEYAPSTGRKIASFLLGTLSRGGASASQAFNEAPYMDAYKQWTDEGKFIDDRARLLEADKNREIKATEFALRQKNIQAQREAISKDRARALTGSLAGAEVRNINADEARRLQEARDKFSREMGEQRLSNESERLRLAREKLEFEQNKPGSPTQLARIDREAREKIKRDLQETASGLGLRYRSSTPPAEIARSIAEYEVRQDPQFSQYIKKIPDPNSPGGFRYEVPDDWKDIVKRRIQARIDSMLKGVE